ncbi:WXG repeat protein [Saccharomonospora cyanea NA-134]|uniref:WXG repeat protein n=2 Tax=Saccharomonospora cyanea TaxID=40989 RepID=H5XNL9_9PSEU|nr:WXG repeat protein [Saccharomonospora cyanea NA-134]
MFAGGGLMDANTDTLARVVQMAAVVVQEIEGHRSRLEGEVNSVIPAQWNMDQSRALLVAHRKWDEAIRNLCQKLEKLGEDTRLSMNDYLTVDQEGASCLNGVGDGGDFGGGGDSGRDGGDGGDDGDDDSDDGGDDRSSSDTYAFAGLLRAL